MHLIIDMDGTFLKNDFFIENLIANLISNPFCTFFKIITAKNIVDLKVKTLQHKKYDSKTIDLLINYNLEKWINNNKNLFESVNIVTASPHQFANEILSKYNFDRIIGSTNVNLKGIKKLEFIIETFGHDFMYIGDSKVDYCIFEVAQKAILVKENKLISIK